MRTTTNWKNPAVDLLTSGTNSMTLILMSSYHKSVPSPKDLKDPFQENLLIPTMMLTLMTPTLMEYYQTKTTESSNPTCPSSLERKKKDALETKNVRNHTGLSPYLPRTTRQSNSGSKIQGQHLLDS